MTNVRINQLPEDLAPISTDVVAVDSSLGGTTRKVPIPNLGDLVRPVASQPEAEAGSNNTKTMTPLRTAQSITVNAEGANFTAAGPVVASQSLREKAQRVVDVEDYYLSTDLGVIGPALERALAQTNVKRINFGADTYAFDDTVQVLRDNVMIVGPGEDLGELVMNGSAGLLFDVGSDSQRVFHVYFSGLVVSRAVSAAGSKVMRVRNASHFGVEKSRLYMDNKWGSALEIKSGIYHKYVDIYFENSIDHAVSMEGGSGAGGELNGWLVEHKWADCKVKGANAGKGSPQSQGTVIMGDHVSAVWMRDFSCHSHLGAFIDMRGTLANRARNILNLFSNLNGEATLANSNTIRIGAYQSSEVLGGWGEGNEMPAVICTADSSGNRVSNLQLGLKSTDGIEDSGSENRFESNEFVGYEGAGAAVRFKSGSTLGTVKGGEAQQLVNVVVNEAGANAKHHVSDIDVVSISGAPFSGFGGGDCKVEGFLSKDSSPYVARVSATLDVPYGVGNRKVFVTSGTGNVDNLRDGIFYGERVTIHFGQSGLVVRDVNVSGGNLVLGTVSDTVTSDGRLIMTFEWDSAGYWWCVDSNQMP